MGRHGLWIPAAARAGAKPVQNAVAAAEATASLEPIAVDVMVDMVRLESVVVARSVDPVVPLAGDAAVEVVRILSIIFSRRLRPPFFYDLG